MPRPLLETSDPSVLALPVAEQFFQELRLFGRMGLTTEKGSILESYRRERVPVMLKFLHALESFRGLRFRSDSHVAFCLPSEASESKAPLFGYTGAEDGPRPTDVVYSLLAFWKVQAELERAPHAALAAVLAHLARHGYEHAFSYLFDMNESGYLNSPSLHSVACLLVQGRALTSTDNELVAALTAGQCGPTTTDCEWLNQSLEVAWLRDRDTSAAAFPGLLVERSWEEVHKLRECSTIDDWAAQLFASMPTLMWLGGLLGASDATTDIAIKAAGSQLEEIRADLYGLWGYQELGIGAVTIVGAVALPQGAPLEQAGDEWVDRAYAERAAVPREVFDGLLGRDSEWSREDWFQLSWRTIVPWAAHFRPGEEITTRRGSMDGPIADGFYAENRPTSLAEAVAPARRLVDQERYTEAIDVLCPLEKHFPYAGPLYVLLNMVLDNSGRHREALRMMLAALALQPGDPFMWTTSARVAYTNGCESDAKLLEAFGATLARDGGR